MNGKSTVLRTLRESGSAAESPGGVVRGKVRPGAKALEKVINESGTASFARLLYAGAGGVFFLQRYKSSQYALHYNKWRKETCICTIP